MDEFTLFVLFGFIVAIGIFLALGKWYPGSGAEQVDWRPDPLARRSRRSWSWTTSTRCSRPRTRAGAPAAGPERTEEDVRAQVAEDERWREELRRRARGDAG